MNNKDNQIDEFCSLCKFFMKSSKHEDFRAEFPRVYTLNTMEIRIITIVYSSEDVILKEICDELDIPKSTLTSAINRLERLNYINRIISTRDKRSYGLKLTEEGYSVHHENVAYERKVYGYLLHSLDTNEERQLLMDLLKKISRNM